MVVPLLIGALAGGEHDARNGAQGRANQMRRGEFDDASDASGAKVIVNDDQSHKRSSVANDEQWSIVWVGAREFSSDVACLGRVGLLLLQRSAKGSGGAIPWR